MEWSGVEWWGQKSAQRKLLSAGLGNVRLNTRKIVAESPTTTTPTTTIQYQHQHQYKIPNSLPPMARKAEQKKPIARTGDLAPVTSLIPPHC